MQPLFKNIFISFKDFVSIFLFIFGNCHVRLVLSTGRDVDYLLFLVYFSYHSVNHRKYTSILAYMSGFPCNFRSFNSMIFLHYKDIDNLILRPCNQNSFVRGMTLKLTRISKLFLYNPCISPNNYCLHNV